MTKTSSPKKPQKQQLFRPLISNSHFGHTPPTMTSYYDAKADKTPIGRIIQRGHLERLFIEAAARQHCILQKLIAGSEQLAATSLIQSEMGICSLGVGPCKCAGEVVQTQKRHAFARVFECPQKEKNCFRCHHFLTGPAYLPGLVIRFDWLTKLLSARAGVLSQIDKDIENLKRIKDASEKNNEPFMQANALALTITQYKEEASAVKSLWLDVGFVKHLINSCCDMANINHGKGGSSVATGDVDDMHTPPRPPVAE